MTTPFAPIHPSGSQDKPACPSRAALFAALFQALGSCSSEQRSAVLDLLESRLGSAYDDLNGKLSLLLEPGAMSVEDKIYGLWMLFFSFLVHPQPRSGVQMWIGADLFGDDQRETMRLRGPADVLPEPLALERELAVLAAAISGTAQAKVERAAPDQLSITVSERLVEKPS